MSIAQKKQSVYIVRYGLTKFPLLESVGPFNSDIDPTEGVEHAKCIARRIASETPPIVVYSSPFTRCAHTAQLIALELGPSPVVRIEEGLTEWLIPSLLVEPNGVRTIPKTIAELAVVYGTIDDAYKSVNPEVEAADDATEGSPKFEETEEALMKRCATTIQRMLEHVKEDSFVIVSHAPCDQSIAYFLEGASSPAESRLGPWPLGGITKFSRTINEDGLFGPWTMDRYGDTDHMPGKYNKGIKHWSLPCLAD